jgi:hypothetical protein
MAVNGHFVVCERDGGVPTQPLSGLLRPFVANRPAVMLERAMQRNPRRVLRRPGT